MLEVPVGTDAETPTLLWLVNALERAREGGHERLVGYLEAVADDAVFEAEAAARGAGGQPDGAHRCHGTARDAPGR